MSSENEPQVTLVRAVKDPRPAAKHVELAKPVYNFPPRRDLNLDEEHVTSKRDRHRQRMMRKNVKVSFLKEQAENAAHSENLYSSLKFYIILLIFVVIELVISRDNEELFWQTSNLGHKTAIEEMLPVDQASGPFWGKTFLDVGQPEEWYQWTTQVLLPMYWDGDSPNTRTYENNLMLGNNMKVGAMRFRVVNVDNNGCSPQSRWIPEDASIFPQDCYPAFDSSAYNKTAFDTLFRYQSCSNPIVRRLQGKVRTWSCSGVVHDVPFSYSYNLAKQDLELLQSTQFVDTARARLVMMSALTYNNNLDTFSLAQAWVEITAGGTYLPQYRTIHYNLMRDQDKVMTIFLMLATFLYLFDYVSGLVTAKRRKEALKYVVDLWNIVTFLDLVLLFIMLGTRYAYWSISDNTQFRFFTREDQEIYSDDLEYVAALYDLGVIVFGGVVGLTMLTVLKFLSLNPNLNLLTRALARAQQDLLGLLVLFITVLLAYSITANVLFGSGHEEYRNLEVSFSSLMRMLLGDVDYYELRAEQHILAGIFFWSFMLIGMFLLLNFIIAVIGSGFDQEKESTKSQSLYDQIIGFVNSTIRTCKRFIANPKGFFCTGNKFSKDEWAKGGKWILIVDSCSRYRSNLPLEDIDPEDFAQMLEDEQESVMPDPLVSRVTLDEIIRGERDILAEGAEQELDPEEFEEMGNRKLDFLGENFLDDFWFEAAEDYERMHEDEVSVKIRRRQGLMEQCAENQLKEVLGLGGSRASEEVQNSLTQLFAPTHATLDHLAELEGKISSMESTTDKVANMLCKLDSLATLGPEGTAAQANNKKDVGSSADKKDGQAKTSADRVPLVKPKRGLQPL